MRLSVFEELLLPSPDRAVVNNLKILKTLILHIVDGASFTLLMNKTQLNKKTLSKRLKFLKFEGCVVKDENGNYRITKKGVEYKDQKKPHFTRSKKKIEEARSEWPPITVISGNDNTGTAVFKGFWKSEDISGLVGQLTELGAHGYFVFTKEIK